VRAGNRRRCAGTPSKEIAARTELTPIATLTLSDAQFLKGDAAGAKPVTIAGEFRAAQGPGRHPVVVMIHGSGGIGGNFDPWERLFNAMGISTFTIDGFTGRGLQATNTDQSLLGRLNFILDIYRALDLLAKNPRVDPDRIALMGFSRGGQAVLYASVARFNEMWNKSGIRAVAYLAFYPDCTTTYIDDRDWLADRCMCSAACPTTPTRSVAATPSPRGSPPPDTRLP
jgi:dienelactone hydrolase